MTEHLKLNKVATFSFKVKEPVEPEPTDEPEIVNCDSCGIPTLNYDRPEPQFCWKCKRRFRMEAARARDKADETK